MNFQKWQIFITMPPNISMEKRSRGCFAPSLRHWDLFILCSIPCLDSACSAPFLGIEAPTCSTQPLVWTYPGSTPPLTCTTLHSTLSYAWASTCTESLHAPPHPLLGLDFSTYCTAPYLDSFVLHYASWVSRLNTSLYPLFGLLRAPLHLLDVDQNRQWLTWSIEFDPHAKQVLTQSVDPND